MLNPTDPTAFHQAFAAARQRAALFDLSARDRLRIAGRDAASFQNRLLTYDVRNLPAGAGARVFLLDARGRVELAFHLLRLDEETFLADCAPGHGEAVLEGLDRFHFGEALTFTAINEAHGLLHLAGPKAPALLAGLGLKPPEAAHAHHEATLDGAAMHLVRHDRLGDPGFDLWICRPKLDEVQERLRAAGAVPGDGTAFEALRVNAGRPEHANELGPHTVPLDVGALDGISEGKGCYPGQEVIERTLALGKPAQRLVTVWLDGPADAGADITRDGALVGALTSVAPHPDGRFIGLAVLRRRHADADEWQCGDVRLTPRALDGKAA